MLKTQKNARRVGKREAKPHRTLMALFEASDFSGYSSTWAVPAGEITPLFTGSVDLVMTTNVTQVVFDTLSTALRCIHYMSANDL